MPFCSQCGSQVGPVDSFCGRCGAPQPVEKTPPPTAADPLANVNPRTASILCYVPWLGWIAAIVVLASQRFRQERIVRFHAFQALYLFVAWLMNDWVFRPFARHMIPGFHLHQLIQLALLGMSIFMMVKAAHDKAYSLPVFGELAQRSMAED